MRRRDLLAVFVLLAAVLLELAQGDLEERRRPEPAPEQPGPADGTAPDRGPDPETDGPERRPAPRPPIDPERFVPLPSLELVDVQVPARQEAAFSSGTAFAVGDGSRLVTAFHVVNGCRSVLVGEPEGGVFRAVTVLGLHPAADLALLDSGRVRHPPLAMARAPDGPGAAGFHYGFPAGKPGAAESRLLGAGTMRMSGARHTREPVLVWAEVRHVPEGLERLSGVSGGPALDTGGRVVGVTVAEARRRGRIYTSVPESIAGLFARPPDSSDADAGQVAIGPDNWLREEERLRRSGRVLKVVCTTKQKVDPGTEVRLR